MEGFFDAFTFNNAEEAIEYLSQWCEAVERTSLIFMKKFINTLKAHWSSIITNFAEPNVNKGILEGIKQKKQLAKRRARGFALISNFIDLAYFVSRNLKFDYPYFVIEPAKVILQRKSEGCLGYLVTTTNILSYE